jgi:hypothetical protein
MRKQKKNPKVECLRNWADSLINNLIKMDKEGKSKEEQHAYIQIGMAAGQIVEGVLENGPKQQAKTKEFADIIKAGRKS